jgi:hypothetical protein
LFFGSTGNCGGLFAAGLIGSGKYSNETSDSIFALEVLVGPFFGAVLVTFFVSFLGAFFGAIVVVE